MDNLDYGNKYLIYHLKEAGRWDDIKKLKDHPIFGEQAREALKDQPPERPERKGMWPFARRLSND